MIEVDHLTKRYGPFTAVNDISFRVEKGEIVGFLGPNGAGKTTTMRILTCYLPATEGTARIAGFDAFEEPLEVKRRIGYLPEHPPVYQDMHVETYLHFVAKIKGVASSERKARVEEVMGRCGILDRRRQLIGQLSKGYQQRVGLAQAIVHNPDVIVLDEPTIGLDPNQIREVRQLIKDLAQDHTVILSTHILPEVEMVCGRVIIINRGEIVAVDSTENLTRGRQGEETIYLEASGSAAEVERVIREVEGVRDVMPVGVEGASSAFRVVAGVEADVRPALTARLVEADMGVLEMRRVDVSLEDIFHELTTTEEVSA